MSTDLKVQIERNDLFTRRRGNGLARVNFVSADGSVNYRVLGARRVYYSKRENFLKNWTRLTAESPSTDRQVNEPTVIG